MVSTRLIVAKLASDYGVEAGAYETNIKIWCSDHLRRLYIGKDKGKFSKTFTIADYYVTLPCNINDVISIEYRKYRYLVPNVSNYANGFTMDNMGFCYFSGNRLYFPIETGEVNIHYKDFFVDKDGWKCIPESQELEESLALYCLMRMLTRGYKHPTISWNDARVLTEQSMQRAVNDVTMPGENEHAAFADLNLRLCVDLDAHSNFYAPVMDNGRINLDEFNISLTNVLAE